MFQFTAKMWLRSNGKAPASRHFVTVPSEIGEQIRQIQADVPDKKRGRGSARVEAQIGYIKRKTSIFPDKESDSFVLPIKKKIRQEFHLNTDDEITIGITLI